jgi:hypothetical protein
LKEITPEHGCTEGLKLCQNLIPRWKNLQNVIHDWYPIWESHYSSDPTNPKNPRKLLKDEILALGFYTWVSLKWVVEGELAL